ncbi:MAG: hypothetical protein KDA80_11000, partial [Planctomycetaceae bacterium]|nr:hypothetical protein [Planctomycetaceae bacterium]
MKGRGDGDAILQETDDMGVTEAESTDIPAGNPEMVSKKVDIDSQFYLPDGIKNVGAVVDDSGVVVSEYLFSAFGKTVDSTGSIANSQQYKGIYNQQRTDPNGGPGGTFETTHRGELIAQQRWMRDEPFKTFWGQIAET